MSYGLGFAILLLECLPYTHNVANWGFFLRVSFGKILSPVGIVTCSGHPSRCWPRSVLLGLRVRDQERHATASPGKLALWQGIISSLLYCPPNFPLHREASPQSLTWVLSRCLAPAQQQHSPFMTTTTIVPGRYHVRTRMNPHPYPELHKLYLKQASTNTRHYAATLL
jgi:hypothetical protein